MNEIQDIRLDKEFKNISFSNYKKSEVKSELIKHLLNENIEESCYWCAELICAGHFKEIWDLLILFFNKHIHLGNIKLPIYLELRYNNFKDILINGYIDNELRLRNNCKIRTLFAEVICFLCLSKKKSSINNNIKLTDTDFNLVSLQKKLKAPTTNYLNKIFRENDPKELTISINELSYHLSKDSNNTIMACYWINWIIEYDSKCNKQKKTIHCERREKIPVESKFQTNCIWMIWDIFYQYSKSKDQLITKIINSSLTLYCLKYNITTNKKRKELLYFIVMLINEKFDKNVELIQDKKKVNVIVNKIETIYKQIKKNEISPNMDYLFNGIEKNNLEKTISKLETMNNNDIFLPRVANKIEES